MKILQASWNAIPVLLLTIVMGLWMNTDLPAQTDAPKRLTPELLWKMGRLGESAASADGNQVAFAVRRYDLAENKGRSSLYLLDLNSGEQSTLLDNWKSVGDLQWIKNSTGEQLYFSGAPFPEDQEQESPKSQAFTIDLETKATRQITFEQDGISNLKVAPTGDKLAFTVDVKLDPKPDELYPDLPKADARIINGLMYRHWDAWHDYAYSHVHVAELNEQGVAGKSRDLMEGIKADCPVPPFGGAEQFNWSPDGKQLAFTMKNVDQWERSTNSNVYLVPADGSAEAKDITVSNLGYDNNPTFSPDGKYLAYQSMERPGFESDRNRIMIFDRQSGRSWDLTEGLDQNANHPVWLPDSSGVIFASERRGTNQLFKLELKNRSLAQISDGRYNWDPVAVMPDQNSLLATRQDMIRPSELTVLSIADGSSKVVTGINDEIYEGLELPTIEERWVEATDGEKIHCWVIHPPEFDAASDKKWPMLTYCQGGPQGQIGQWFSFRWNFHLMASEGYVVLAPNRRGLPGFGRQWNDVISGDWGGQAMRDLLSTTDEMLNEPYIDPDRVAAVGASFGGYSVYWLMGNAQDRFSAMIAHCGVFNLESMYGSTEELFFVNWDLGGPYWKSDDIFKKYQQFSPHRFVGNWKTPLLVIHGQKDFRVPVTQGMEAFTAAQVQGVPSRFLYFPEEGHWVNSPQNSVLWQRVFFDWLDRYCKSK